MNIAAGGLLSELTYSVPSEVKSIFGYFAYVIKGAEMLPAVRTMPMKLEYDGGVYDGPASMFFLGLTNSVGGFEQIVPDAELGDGKFSLIIVKTANMANLLKLMALVFNGGRHVDDPNIVYTKTKKLKVKTSGQDTLKINLDGEYGGDAPMTFVNLKQHIAMYANVDEIPTKNLGTDAQKQRDYMAEVESISHRDIDGDGQIGAQDEKDD